MAATAIAGAAYLSCGNLGPAPPPPDDRSLRVLRLCAIGRVPQAIAAASASPTSTLVQPSALAALLHACARGRLLALGRSLHRLVLPLLPHDLFLSNHLLNMYAKCGRLDLARRVFDGMPRRNLVSWTALLSGLSQRGLGDDCFRILAAMLLHEIPNEFALSAALSTCTGTRCLVRGRQVHALASKTCLDANIFVGNALITMYASCCDNGRAYEKSWTIFQAMPFRNLITWNSMIAALQRSGCQEQSRDLFAQMHRQGVGFDRVTIISAASSCSTIQNCQQLHCLMIKTCYDRQVEVATALIKAYSTSGGDVHDCYKVFDGVREHDIISWTNIMTLFADQRPEEAILLFCQLRRRGFRPDRYTLSTAVKACGGLATERHCSAVHSLIEKSVFRDDVVLSNALIHAYARSGEISLAENVFDHMVVRDKVSWNSMIKAYAAHGRGQEALNTFKCMDVSPDSATFIGLLTACSHGGLVSEGQDVFKAMSKLYGIVPQLDHYACMVDILGRAGKLHEAEDLINQMPMEPDFVIWSSLLGACRKHRETGLAEKAAQKLMEIEPQNSAAYVMMSNIYSVTGCLEDASSLRKEMKEFGVKKEPGLSWVEIDNHVYEFSAGARHHPQHQAIYSELTQLATRLKEMGYDPDKKLVVHEIEEEHKVERLLNHSEKFALVFALMSIPAAQTTVKIMKNIRICEDCHNFMKLASKCTGKEIVVRDANRFHHISSGTCSCGDYW